MLTTSQGVGREFSAEQPLNALSSIDMTLGIVADVRAVQPRKAAIPIEVTSGIMAEVRAVQPLNAKDPIDVTLGIVTKVRAMQYSKAFSEIDVSDDGAANVDAELQLYSAHVSTEMVVAEEVTILFGSRESHPWKGCIPIEMILGIVTKAREEQP